MELNDWESPSPEKCQECGRLLRDHWRSRPCISSPSSRDTIELTDLRQKEAQKHGN